MKKTFLTMAATAALVLMCSPRMDAAALTVMTLDAGGGITASIDDTGACTGSCANLTVVQAAAHGTIQVKTKTGTNFGGFTINATGVGGADSTLPTLQNLNQIEAEKVGGGSGVLKTTFLDTFYPTVSSLLDIADSNTTDQQIATSSIQFTVFTGPSAGPATTQVDQNTLTGHSNNFDAIVGNPNNPLASIMTQTVMTFAGLGTIQANITVANVLIPEPAGIVLMGTTLLGVAALIRKKQAKRA